MTNETHNTITTPIYDAKTKNLVMVVFLLPSRKTHQFPFDLDCEKRTNEKQNTAAARGTKESNNIVGRSVATILRHPQQAAKGCKIGYSVLPSPSVRAMESLLLPNISTIPVWCSDKPCLHQLCSSIPDNLIESELFRLRRPLAASSVPWPLLGKSSLVELRRRYPLFLDEIGEPICFNIQVKLLDSLRKLAVYIRWRSGNQTVIPVSLLLLIKISRNSSRKTNP